MTTPATRSAQSAPAAGPSSIAAGSSATAMLRAQPLPPLPAIALDAATLAKIGEPAKRIASEEDVERWKQSEAYAIYLLFLQRVCEAVVGQPTRLPLPPPTPLASTATPVDHLVNLLYELDSWTDAIQPQSKPQRFGNLAFRDWGARLASRIDALHTELLPHHLHAFVPELKAYLLDSFGSFTRIDYGSGHELAFFAWLCLLYRLGFFTQEQGGKLQDAQVEEAIGLEIFPLYLMVVWRLQDRYGLEPAGSHGVWGLDDFQFLPYVLGAAQLRIQSTLRPAQIVPASAHPSLLSSQLGADKSPRALIASSLTVPSTLLIPDDTSVVVPNLYLTSLLRIQVLKRGPFHEHSPLLHDIATTVPNWVKVHAGMLKMYCAECLGKKVVVQHFPFGGVGFVWEDRPVMGASTGAATGGGGQRGMALGGVQGNMGSMGVPTARVTTGMPGAGTRFPRNTPGSALGSAGRLGHALGLGPRVGQVNRASATTNAPPTPRPAEDALGAPAVPPFRAVAPPATSREAAKQDEKDPSS